MIIKQCNNFSREQNEAKKCKEISVWHVILLLIFFLPTVWTTIFLRSSGNNYSNGQMVLYGRYAISGPVFILYPPLGDNAPKQSHVRTGVRRVFQGTSQSYFTSPVRNIRLYVHRVNAARRIICAVWVLCNVYFAAITVLERKTYTRARDANLFFIRRKKCFPFIEIRGTGWRETNNYTRFSRAAMLAWRGFECV